MRTRGANRKRARHGIVLSKPAVIAPFATRMIKYPPYNRYTGLKYLVLQQAFPAFEPYRVRCPDLLRL